MTSGVYRVSGGVAMACRSVLALALAAAGGAVLAWWAAVEERYLRRTLGPP